MIRQLLTYRDGCTDPHRNLATEAYLTETVPEDTCILYLWQNRHTVVIGRNQNAWRECRTTLLEQEGGVLARRLSGGGAVYHDMGNLNFTFSLPTAAYDLRRQQEVLVAACRRLGIPAECSGRNDILTGGRKFSGNSFYHHGGRSFHNGTLLIDVDMEKLGRYLAPSQGKLESKGVASVRSRVVNLSQIQPGRCGRPFLRYTASPPGGWSRPGWIRPLWSGTISVFTAMTGSMGRRCPAPSPAGSGFRGGS